MPKKGRNGRGKGNGDSALFPFHTIINSALNVGAFNVLLSPNGTLTPRGLIEADAWAHFRVKMLHFRLTPITRVSFQACGYVGGVQDTLPTTVSQAGELLPSVAFGQAQTVPSEWVKVSAQDLAGPLPWYKTIPGTADPTEESPGVLVVVGSASDAFSLEVRGIFEFKTSVATGNTPAAIAARARLREERIKVAMATERDVLLRILGGIPSTPPP